MPKENSFYSLVKEILKNCDIFSSQINFNYKNKRKYSTSFGGASSIVVIILCLLYIIQQVFIIIIFLNKKKTHQYVNDDNL